MRKTAVVLWSCVNTAARRLGQHVLATALREPAVEVFWGEAPKLRTDGIDHLDQIGVITGTGP
jgi:hypothetical protein